MFGFKIINEDGNVCVDEANPVYSLLADPASVELLDPTIYDAQIGNTLENDGGGLIGGFFSFYAKFKVPLNTVNPPILLARRKQGQVAATLFAGYCVIGGPGAWLGVRVAVTTSDPSANSSNAAVAYDAVRRSICDLALCIPGAVFSPGISIRVADAEGRLIFDALGYHALDAQNIPGYLVTRTDFSNSPIASLSVFDFPDNMSGNEWLCVSGGIGPIIRPTEGIVARSIVSFGANTTRWLGYRYQVGSGNVTTSSFLWKTRTRRRLPGSGIVLPAL